VAYGTENHEFTATKCVSVAPHPAGIGEPCTGQQSAWSGVDDCDQDSMCHVLDEQTLQGVCLEFCQSEQPPYCSDPRAICPMAYDDVAPLCYPVCDPLASDCGAGSGCYYRPKLGLICLPDFSGDGGGRGSPCDASFQCDPGSVCVLADYVSGCSADVGCCSPFCSLLEDPATVCTDAPGETCEPYYLPGHAPEGQGDVGLCRVE
jgi:hypothetical protein